MSDLPDPFVPPECDLRGMPYMPLDIGRLFDSDFYVLSSGDEFKAGVSLWGKAFLQVPAGSLPDDDRILAHLSGANGLWKKVRSVALRGWIKCSDGRLYHRTVAEKVAEAWQARLARRARTEAARAARADERGNVSGSNTPPSATMSVTDNATGNVTNIATRIVTKSVAEVVTGSKGSTREGKGREGKKEREESPPTPRKRGACDDPDFETFWQAYPRKVGKGQARRAWATAARKISPAEIIAALGQADFNPDPKFQPHASTWLNGERWLDQTDQFDPLLRAVGLTQDDFADLEPQGRLQ